MNPRQALNQTILKFRQNKLEEAENEAAVLVCHVLNLDKAGLYADPDLELNESQLAELENGVLRRLNGEPAAYIIKNKEFYGIDLYVDQRVLIPRPETETLVDETIKFIRAKADKQGVLTSALSIADVGTGSGAIAIALAMHIPKAKIYAIDLSGAALEVAAINIERYGLNDRIELLEGSLLEPVEWPLDVIVANLPYIEDKEIPKLATEIAGYEPRMALDGGNEGIALFRDLIEQSKNKLDACGALFMEIGEGQGSKINAIVRQISKETRVSFIDDLRGIPRLLKVEKLK